MCGLIHVLGAAPSLRAEHYRRQGRPGSKKQLYLTGVTPRRYTQLVTTKRFWCLAPDVTEYVVVGTLAVAVGNAHSRTRPGVVHTERRPADPLCARPEYSTTSSIFWVGPETEPAHLLNEREHRAKQLCWECPERVPCGQWARDREEKHGVWGGEGTADRGFVPNAEILVGGTPLRDYLPGDEQCGTIRGVANHIARKERICPVCVRWAFEMPECGTPSGVAHHIRVNADLNCKLCFPATRTKKKRKVVPEPRYSRRDCGTSTGPEWHRLVKKEPPCSNCSFFVCGTDAGYAGHRRYQEVPCPACRAAHAAENRRRRRANKEAPQLSAARV